MSEFGILLRNLRESCRDPHFPARRLSQQKFGELLGLELGTHGYSGAAVSDWERGKSKIHVDERRVLVALLKVLYECGGVDAIESANRLLESGNYRALDRNETVEIFNEIPEAESPKPARQKENKPTPIAESLLRSLFAIPEKDAKVLLTQARKGPDPSWPRILAVFMRQAAERFSLSLHSILWMGVWLFAIWLIGPSLRLPFVTRDAAFRALCAYAIGTLIIPLLIGLLVNTKDNEYWRQQNSENPRLVRLYTYQGAGIGFNLGYFFIFPISLIRHYLGLEPSIWVELAAAMLGMILGNMGARVTPHNLLLAYKRLTLADGWIFFVVALVGPLWAVFFLEFYSTLLHPTFGVIVILLALAGVVLFTGKTSKKQTA